MTTEYLPSRAVPLWSMFTRVKDVGHPGEEMLSVYREHGVVRKDARSDNYNKTAENRNIYQLVGPGWLIVNRMKAWQGSVGISPYRGIVSGHYICFRPHHREDPRFLNYLLRSPQYAAEFTKLSRGVRPNQTEIDNDGLRALPIRLPDLRAQRAIADYLDTETARIDALITKKRRMIELLDERLRVHRRAYVLGSLNPVLGTGVAPDQSWDLMKLGVLIHLQRGHDLPLDAREPGEVPIVTSGGLSGYHSRSAAPGPGVVTGRYGTIGEVYFVDEDYWPLNTTLYVVDFRGNHPRWIFHLLSALPLDAEKDKSAVTGINRNVIGRLCVPRPCLDQQVRIASYLDTVLIDSDKITSRLGQQIELLLEHRQALITAAVTGELEIPAAA